MHMGRCCQCSKKTAVTLKRFGGTDGVTDWEYGPGYLWSPQYGAGYITGVVPDLSPTINRYVIATSPGGTSAFPDRSTASVSANAFDAFTITKIDISDGSVNASATLEGVFASQAFASSVALLYPATFTESATLSGGDWVVLGQRPPQIELDDYTTNPATKNYTFHAHTMQAGNVVFTTRTSSDTITLPYNCTAANCKTQIETSGDVSSATVTGGPWPHAKLDVTVTWNGTGDDFADVTPDATYTVGLGTRSVMGTATAYSPSTGLITSSVGYIFGNGSGVSASLLISQFGTVPSTTDPAAGPIYHLVAGPSDDLIIESDNQFIQGVSVGAPWSILWSKQDNLGVTVRWQHAEGGTVALPSGGRVDFTTPAKSRNGVLIAVTAGTVTEIDDSLPDILKRVDGGRVGFVAEEGTATNRHLIAHSVEFTDPDYAVTFRHRPDGKDVETPSADEYCTSINFALPTGHADSSSLLGIHSAVDPMFNYDPPASSPTNWAGSASYAMVHKIYCYTGPYENATEWRIRFQGAGIYPTAYSDWIAWNATAATIKTAILVAFPENTEGVVSNVQVNPFGAPAALDNTSGLLNRGLELGFAGGFVADVTTFGFIPIAQVRKDKIRIETRTVDDRYGNGIVLIDHSDASETWSRAWGTVGGSTVGFPTRQWLRGGNVYAYGQIVDNDLP
jgi:hypothetical protein